MSLSSIIFLFAFLPCFFLIYYLVPRTWRNAVCLLGSIAFYSWGEPYFIVPLLLAVAANYGLGLLLRPRQKRRRTVFVLGCVFNLGLLFVFKYAAFFFTTAGSLFGLSADASLSLPPPIGLSFFVFRAVSYLADVYLEKTSAETHFPRFSLYMCMFPCILQGPLGRYGEISPQIADRRVCLEDVSDGIFRFTVGLAKKVLLSVPLGVIADSAWSSAAPTVLGAWLGLISYAMQLYFDFSGYTDMALGLGRMMGFHLLENFNYPYLCTSVSDFWRRWHMTLSLWFRDYVYFPLGGSRTDKLRLVRNLLIVWTLTGLWHGANMTFVLWGLYFGVLLCIEKLFRLEKRRIPQLVRHVVSLLAVLFGWVFFRSESVSQAMDFFTRLFSGTLADEVALLHLHDGLTVLFVGLLACTPLVKKLCLRLTARRPNIAALLKSCAVLVLLFLCTVYLVNSSYSPFLYLRF